MERCTLLIGFALLVVLRLPHAWRQGRFIAEEGTFFFAFAWHRPPLEALFHSFGGYLNIAANATTLLAVLLVRADIVPLEQAPYVTMLLALAMQVLPAVLLVTGQARWLANRWSVVASLMIVAMAPMTEEVFVNVLHIQFHLALCVALILALDVPASVRRRCGYAGLLFVAPLCGPGAMIVLPLFGLRTLLDRDRARLTQAAILAAGTAVQLAVFFHPSPVRGDLLGPATLASILFVKLFALPVFGAYAANGLGRGVYYSHMAGGIGWWWATVAAAIAYFGWLLAVAVRWRRNAALWLILAALAIGVVTFSGGMIFAGPREWFGVAFDERYHFLPLVLLGCGIVGLAAQPEMPNRRFLVALVGLTLFSGAATYPVPIRQVSDGPDWNTEVAAWRRDHHHRLAAWPEGWRVDLSDENRPCTPPRLGPTTVADPGYCESAWLARISGAVSERL